MELTIMPNCRIISIIYLRMKAIIKILSQV